MKDRETQLAFIKARAEGKSYGTIAKELGISKATCTSWERSLRGEIDTLRQAQLEELYAAYGMKREARIKALGEILQGLDKAIAGKPLEELPADKLLELRLKYGRALREEYIEPIEPATDDTLNGLLEQYNQLYRESKARNYSSVDVRALLSILDAKKDAMRGIATEQSREEQSALPFGLHDEYVSKLIRHEDQRGA